MSRKGHLVVCLEDKLYWFNLRNARDKRECIETGTNPKGLFAVSDDGKLLAYPVEPRVVAVRHGEEDLTRIQLAFNPSKLQFNQKGAGKDLLAVGSEDGKSVLVWSLRRPVAGGGSPEGANGGKTDNATLEYEFSRSVKRACSLESLDFNVSSTLLSLGTDSGTLHVFEMKEGNRSATSSAWTPSFLRGWVSSVGSKYKVRLPSASPCLSLVMFEDEAFPDLPDQDLKDDRRNIFVLTAEGMLLEYVVPLPSAQGDANSVNNEISTPVRKEYLFSM